MDARNKHILLIKPPFRRLYHPSASLDRLPLSLAYLAAVIADRKSNWDVTIYNSDFSPKDYHLSLEYLTGPGFERYRKTIEDPAAEIWREIESRIRSIKPSVIGITSTSQTFAATYRIAQIAKTFNPDILIVVGGPHSSIFEKDILNNNHSIDIGIIGEGEETIIDLLDTIDQSRGFASIQGIAYRDNGSIIQNEPRSLIDNLDLLPFPISIARKSLIDFKKYPLQAFKFVLASRGCPFECAFCDSRHVWSRRVRTRTADNVRREIEEIILTGLKTIHFIDDTWGVDRKFVRELCEMLSGFQPRIHWSCETHVNYVDEESVKLMKNAGCRMIQIGIESGNNEILKSVKKEITIEKAFAAAEIIKKHGLYLQTFFIVGFPNETVSSLNDTILAMKTIPTDQVIYNTFTPAIGANSFGDGGRVSPLSADFDATIYHHQSPANYFCRGFPQAEFKERLRRLERELDTLNSRKNLRMFLSREGFYRMREKGLVRTLKKAARFGKSALRKV